MLCRRDRLKVNRGAIDPQVRVDVNGWVLARQAEGVTGEGNQNDLVLHFGLGPFDQDVPVEATWPNGQVQAVSSTVDATITVEKQECLGRSRDTERMGSFRSPRMLSWNGKNSDAIDMGGARF